MINGVSETLFIPLESKARVYKYGSILRDKKAMEFTKKVKYDFSKNKSTRFVDIYMGIRAALLDRLTNDFINRFPQGTVIHLGCGLDSRVLRVKKTVRWIDIDLPEVIKLRRKFYNEQNGYSMVCADVIKDNWIDKISVDPKTPVLVVAEGLTMYFTQEENKKLFNMFHDSFCYTEYIFDAYSWAAVKWSKWKNPANKLGAVIRWGLDEPKMFVKDILGAEHIDTFYFTGRNWRRRIYKFSDRFLFTVLYGNKWATNLYRIYRFQIHNDDLK